MTERQPHPAALPSEKLAADCQVRRQRRSGPGGQHRNKVETAIVLVHQPTGVRAEASERRSQEQNRQVAIGRLRLQLALTVRAEPTEEPSPMWRERVRGKRLSINSAHADFPALLAEGLDVLAAEEWDVRSASDRLGVTTSQLIKLLNREPPALALLNEQRSARGLKPLSS